MRFEEIENIIIKKITGEVTPEELVILKKWRMESGDNQLILDSYSTTWEVAEGYDHPEYAPDVNAAFQKHLSLLESEEPDITKVIDIQNRETKKVTQQKGKILNFRSLTSIAAILVLGIAAIFLFTPDSLTTISAGDNIRFASLEDGSKVWLDKGSSISYKNDFGGTHRTIMLEGKAFFDVERNRNLEFVINSDDMKVSVLGTSFTVDTKSDERLVSVATGQVKLSLESGKTTNIKANESVVVDGNDLIPNSNTPADLSWRNSELSFDNAPLEQVIADINLFHDNKIVLKTKSNIDCPFTSGRLLDESFDNIISVLKSTYDLEIEDLNQDKIQLTISDCR